MTDRITLRSSYADLTVDRATGAVIKRDYAAMGGTNEWDDVERFDPETFVPHLVADSETDVLYAGFWTVDGTYVEPVYGLVVAHLPA